MLLILRTGRPSVPSSSKPPNALCGVRRDIKLTSHRGWVSSAGWAGVEIADFPNLKAWEDRMWARPAIKKGADVPDKYTMKEKMADKETMEKYAAEVSLRDVCACERSLANR